MIQTEMNQQEWFAVFETGKMYEALMVQSHLEVHNIKSVIYNQQDSVYITIGRIKIMVKVEEGFKALQVIEELMM